MHKKRKRPNRHELDKCYKSDALVHIGSTGKIAKHEALIYARAVWKNLAFKALGVSVRGSVRFSESKPSVMTEMFPPATRKFVSWKPRQVAAATASQPYLPQKHITHSADLPHNGMYTPFLFAEITVSSTT